MTIATAEKTRLQALVRKWNATIKEKIGGEQIHRAGLFGQMPQESRVDVAAEETPGSIHGGKGLIQWTGSRFTQTTDPIGLRTFAQLRGKPWQDEETQILFMCRELGPGGPYHHVWQAILTTTTLKASTETIMARYEGPAGWQQEIPNPGSTTANLPRRLEGANIAFAEIQKIEGAPIVVDTSGTGTKAPAPSTTGADLLSVEQAVESFANQLFFSKLPAAAPIVSMIENAVVNPILPSINATLGKQIDSNDAAHAVFNFGVLAIGFLATKFITPAVAPKIGA